MALNVKTIIKLYLLFFIFQIGCNIFIETMPLIHEDINSDNQNYLNFITLLVNGEFDTESTGSSLLTNLREQMEISDLFNDGVIQAFWGVLQVIGSVIWFIIQLAVNLLFTPSVLMQILFYSMIISSYLFVSSLIVNIFFYMTLFYIIYKARIQQ